MHWDSYARALLVSKDRRHLFVTPWGQGFLQFTLNKCKDDFFNTLLPFPLTDLMFQVEGEEPGYISHLLSATTKGKFYTYLVYAFALICYHMLDMYAKLNRPHFFII